jgi:hypothetical protein
MCEASSDRMIDACLIAEGEAWWARQDSNLQPDRYERPALTIELQARAALRVTQVDPSLIQIH